MATDGVKDIGGPAKHTRRRGADLDKILAYWLAGHDSQS